MQLEDSKSRLLQSGAYIARAKQKSGECIRLQTFDFLGFTFYCGRSRKGMPYIMPKTSSKKFRQKIRDIKVWLYANRDQPLKKLMGMLNLKLIGHYRYYGISFNGRMISNYKQQVRELLFKVLNRRSDRKSYTREGFIEQKNLKESLILQHKPEVLGEMKDIPKPDVSNEESVREYFCKIKTRSEMIAEMPDNVIPMNFHLYEIRIGDDSLEMEIDYIWNIFGISYSGNKKVMKQFEKISKDLYIYYGVSEDDIKKKTERYLSLVTALSS